ncbi:uncharacterized protein LOC124126446 [Haliotis rufescens]|uniref:uncharacterized protein LOC124126446 n=1 Tax=Haliotis rufescens TaxID=6454 RepID=UPI00201EF435|nr:uncharacterized protein LOC124126446 [Haliotis rufescens]
MEISDRSAFPKVLKTGDMMTFKFTSTNGGYVKVRNIETNELRTEFYQSNSQDVSVSIGYDLVKPYHCSEVEGCSDSLLTVPKTTFETVVELEWDGWKDDTAKLHHYVISAFEMEYSSHEGGVRVKNQVASKDFNDSLNAGNITLPGTGLYSVEITAYDKAGNSRSGRRLVISDEESKVETTANSVLRVTSAAEASSWEWQWTSDTVNIDWENHYINTLHHGNKWLEAAIPVSNVDTVYDDNDFSRGVKHVPNVQAIVDYRVSFQVDHAGGNTIPEHLNDSDFSSLYLNQSHTISPILVDGDSLRYWIRAYDVREEYLEETVTVHIDTSPPIIENLWLTRGDRLNVSVHKIEELSTMTIEWESYDDHSGLEKVSWRVFDNQTGQEIIHGKAHLPPNGAAEDEASCRTQYGHSPRGSNCYCTPGVGCYHRHFQVKPSVIDDNADHGGIFHSKDRGVHDSDYFLEVTVMNHAKLTTTLHLKITIDSSPPHPGAVHDGLTGHSEVDYHGTTDLHAHWVGFFDRESGVKFYQYGFAGQCLDATDFGIDLSSHNVTETSSTHASWTAPSGGRFFITVVAFNRALEPSLPVCSDGVTVDQTSPSLSQIAVLNARTTEGLVTNGEEVWLVTADRRRSQIEDPDATCGQMGAFITNEDLNVLPLLKDDKEERVLLPHSICLKCSRFAMQSTKAMYILKEHHLYVNWTSSDAESGIYDYELGLMSDPSSEAAPDVLPYTSTHHHPHYEGFHPHLSEGQQFHIAVKATNKAGIVTSLILGPVVVHTQPPVFQPPVAVSLKEQSIVAEWGDGAFTDTKQDYLHYSFAIGSSPGGSDIIPFLPLQSGGGCSVSTPPSCTAVATRDLQWDLHHGHTYYVSVKVTNIVGLWTVGVSEPYVHNVRLPSLGVILDVSPQEEQSLLGISKFEDTDLQLSTSTLATRWYGFDDGLSGVTYKVCVGSSPGQQDIAAYEDAGGSLSHRFTNLTLNINQMYFSTVVGINDAGETRQSSDGVTVIRQGLDLNTMTVKDGEACEQGTNSTFGDDLDYQLSSSTYAAHWSTDARLQQLYSDVHFSLEKKLLSSDQVWAKVTKYENIGPTETVTIGGLHLEPGQTYRAVVKLCAAHVCSEPVASNGVIVTPHQPVVGNINITYTEGTSRAQLHVEMDRFRDGDIPVISESYDAVAMYDWSLTDDGHGRSLLTEWTPVDDLIPGDEKVSFTIELAKHLMFSKCRRLSVRGFNKVGTHTILSKDIRDCSSREPNNVIPAIVIDAAGQTDDNGLTSGITLEENDVWQRVDLDYTPYKNMLSAVWPSLRHRKYKWAVIAGDKMDNTSHFKQGRRMTNTDPCAMADVVKCGETDEEYVNVKFDETETLRHGKRFYICIHAFEIDRQFEKWNKTLHDVSACSDGITVDLTPPTPGTINIEGLQGGTFQVSQTEVTVSWDSFTDVEESGSTSHPRGISHYELALGSISGGEDIRSFQDVGQVNHIILADLSLQDGHAVYATVRAKDFVNFTTQVTSTAFIIDSSPPVNTGRNIQMDDRYITRPSVSLCWEGVFIDPHSGIGLYELSLGSRPGRGDHIQQLISEGTCHIFDLSSKLNDGYSIYLTIKAFNGVGLSTVAISRAMLVDTTPPTLGLVFDGTRPLAAPVRMDRDYVTRIGDMGAHWEGFCDPHSSIAHYRIKVGTCSSCEDTMAEYEAGTREDAEFHLQHLAGFAEGIKYHVTVTACNKAGLCSSATSDGVILDQSPPVPGSVMDGTLDRDSQYQASRTFLGCKWHGFQDAQSGLDFYEWRLGTTPGGDDILTPRYAALEEVAFLTLTNTTTMPTGREMFCTVRVYDKAGLFSESTSNGFIIDDSAPEVVKIPGIEGGQGSLVAMTLISRSTVRVSWEVKDEESFIERQYISISSHQFGEFDASLKALPGLLREFTYSQINLHDGSRYRIKVSSCNMAGLCSTSDTGEILLDGSIPTTGALAVETNHAARLTRHHSNYMTWTPTSLCLAWLGFADLHSGIDHYRVTVGSKPFTADFLLTKNPLTFSHNTTGPDKEDEGVVQLITADTKDMSSRTSVFVTIWAVNSVGLRSSPLHSELVLGGGGKLELVRRCGSYSCEGHCVCAVQDKKCGTSQGCTVLKNGGKHAVVTLRDILDLRNVDGVGITDDDNKDCDFSTSDTFLSATWAVTTNQGLLPVRYDYSVGRSNQDSPKGVFNGASERVWFDAGVTQFAVVPLTNGKVLTSGLSYSVFVRAWYDDNTYSIFKSDGVLVDNNGPTTTDKIGNAVKEHREIKDSKDIDYQSSNTSICISWANKFLQGQSGHLKYRLFISTSPGGHSIHGSTDVTETRYTAAELILEPNTVYFSNVMVYNKAGLVSWSHSDGVQPDVKPPVSGHVQDGDGLHDIDFQSSPKDISSSWFGFSDTDSTIIKYFWCVGATNDTSDCSIVDWQDVGLHTSARTSLDSPIADDTSIWTKVYAVDVVGHTSRVVVSDGVVVDTSPPTVMDVAYLGDNMVLNPSFEEVIGTNLSDTVCSPLLSWKAGPNSCIRTLTPDAPNAKHGRTLVAVSGRIQQNITGLAVGRKYKVTVHVGYPETLTADHKAVEGSVTIGREVFTFSLDPRLCKGVCKKKKQSSVLWYTYTYHMTADTKATGLCIETVSRNMEIVLDHVTVQEIEYSGNMTMLEKDSHLVTKSVFLSHWSSVHASWHFEDPSSPITEYTWAVGTTSGGTQLQGFKSVRRNAHGTLSGLRLSHKQKLFLTITARNAAGLTTVSHPDPITADMTPPTFAHINDGEGSDIDFVKVGDVYVNWNVQDEESHIHHCDWSIGSTTGGSDIKTFEIVHEGETSAKFNLADISTSVRVFSTVRCFNKVGLMATATTDGVTVMRDTTSPTTAVVELLTGFSLPSVSRICQRSKSVKVHWRREDIQKTVIKVTDESTTYLANVDNSFEFVTFSGLHFKNMTTYHAEVYPDSIIGAEPAVTRLTFTYHEHPPALADGAKLKLSREGNKAILKWAGVFLSDWNRFHYEVSIGSTEGCTDILERVVTNDTQIALTLKDQDKVVSVHGTVTATDPCGYFTHFTQTVTIK